MLARFSAAPSTPFALDTYFLQADVPLDRITGLKLEALTHASMLNGGPGHGGGNFVVNGLGMQIGSKRSDRFRPVKLRAHSADVSQEFYPATAIVDGLPNTGWAIGYETGKPHHVVFTVAGYAAGNTVQLVLRQDHAAGASLGHFRISVTDSPYVGVPQAIQDILEVAAANRTQEQKDTLAQYVRRQWRGSKETALREEIAALETSVQHARNVRKLSKGITGTWRLFNGEDLQFAGNGSLVYQGKRGVWRLLDRSAGIFRVSGINAPQDLVLRGNRIHDKAQPAFWGYRIE